MDIKDQIRDLINNNFIHTNSGNGLADDLSFLDSGIIDSTGVLELISFVEETFDIEIEDDETIPENLDSLDRLARFIQSKKEYLLTAA